ncbi:Mechanosensitive ion channel-domain-containing protein [Hyaloraphidium curvatum]|nr:Mechanosensitive ion channel-domain-containing protein [Hyaloraphidium curvatum]
MKFFNRSNPCRTLLSNAALNAPGVAPPEDTFTWIDEEVDDRKEVDWSKRETRLTKIIDFVRNKTPGDAALFMAIAGTIVLMIPGIIDLILFVENPLAWWTNFRAKTTVDGVPLFAINGYPVVMWSIWSVISWDVFWLSWYTVPLIPYLSLTIQYAIFGYVSETWHDNVNQFIRVTKKFAILTTSTTVSLVVFRSAFTNPTGITSTVDSFLFVATVVCWIWLMSRFSMSRFARSFQRRIYQERREKSRFEEFVLERLYKAVIQCRALASASVTDPRDPGEVPTPGNAEPDHSAEPSPESHEVHAPAPHPQVTKTTGAAATGIDREANSGSPGLKHWATLKNVTHHFTAHHTVEEELLRVLKTDEFKFSTLTDAKTLARDLFVSLAHLASNSGAANSSGAATAPPADGGNVPDGNGKPPLASPFTDATSTLPQQRTLSWLDPTYQLPFSSFSTFFGDPRLTEKAFALFDLNGDSLVSRQEMKDAVVEIYQDKVALDKSLQNAWQALQKLDALVNTILLFVSVLFYLSVWLDVSVWIAAMASFWAGAMFAFQTPIKNLIESIIFLFITHPFDIGDRVTFGNTSYFVKEMSLMSTCLTHTDGREVYIANPVLSPLFIYNIKRSGYQVETIRMRVDITTTGEKLTKLQTELNTAIKERLYRDFLANVEVYFETMSFEKRTATLQLFLTHRHNFQSGVQRWRRTSAFLDVLREKLAICDIKAGKMKVVEVGGLSEYYMNKSRGSGTKTRTAPRVA